MLSKSQTAFIRYSAVAIAITALIVLDGWQFNIPIFKSLVPSFAAMSPLTAVTFIVCAGWFWLSTIDGKNKVLQIAFSTAIFLAGVSKLIITFGAPVFSTENLLFAKQGHSDMAVTTAIGFLLVGSMSFIHQQRRLRKFFNLLFCFSVILMLVSACSYLFKLNEILTDPSFAPMPPNTCILFGLINFLLAFYFKDTVVIKPFFSRGMGGITGRKLVPYAIGVPIIISWLRYRAHQSGISNPEITVVFMTVTVTFILLVVIWDRARFLNKITREKDDVLERFMYVNRATSDTIFDWDLRTDEVTRYKDFNDFGTDLVTNHFKSIHPDDLPQVKKIISNSLSDPNRHEYTCACRLKRDNEYKNILVKAHILRQEGKAMRIVGAIQDVTEMKSLERKLIQQEKNNRLKLMRSIIEAQERERRSVALELHDNVNQILTSCKLMLETAREQRDNSALIERTYTHIKKAINEIRKISHDLSPSTLEDIGLEEAIEQMIETINLTGKIKITHHYTNKHIDTSMKMDDKIAIFRIIQEQINNVVKYSRANNARIKVIAAEDKVQIAIEDDGVGFDVKNFKKGLGLKNIENRVEYYEGTLDIQSKTNTGCKMDVILNLS